jgi:ArsR family transcriptional regulator
VGVPLYQAKAEFFKTLGHPVRIRLLELLSERDHAVHELLQEIAIEPSNLSQQLAVLRRTQLVVSRRQAGEVIYSVSAPEVRDLLLAARRILTDLIKLDIEPTPGLPASDGSGQPAPSRTRPAHAQK